MELASLQTKKYKRVFVLGAGASKPYNYPTGPELKSRIIKEIRSKSGEIFSVLRHGFPENALLKFAEDFQNSRNSSIDSYLINKDDLTKEIGLTAICVVILFYKERENLFPDDGDWFTYLFNLYYRTPGDTPPENENIFITFNYDETFERMLFESIDKTYFNDTEKTKKYIKTIPLYHVYGSIGEIDLSVPIKTNPTYYRLECAKKASSRIKVMYSDREHIPNDISKKIYDADRVIFFGFGYDSINVDRLGVDWQKTHASLFGTGFGLQAGELERALQCFNGKSIQIETHPGIDCLAFLRRSNI